MFLFAFRGGHDEHRRLPWYLIVVAVLVSILGMNVVPTKLFARTRVAHSCVAVVIDVLYGSHVFRTRVKLPRLCLFPACAVVDDPVGALCVAFERCYPTCD